jgi:hypothetical protein
VAPPGSDANHVEDALAGLAYRPFEEDPRNFDSELFRVHFGAEEGPEGILAANPPDRAPSLAPELEVVEDVRTRFLANVAVLARRDAALANCPTGGVSKTDVAEFKNRHISMVEYQESVTLVHWSQFPCGTFGRPVELDHLNRVKTPVAMNFSVVNYTGSLIIHPNVGLFMGRWTQGNRPAFPTEMLTLKTMWAVALRGQARLSAASSAHESDSIAFCRLCKNLTNLSEPIHECPFCLCAWHASCSSRVAAVSGIGPADGVVQSVIPPVFRQPVDDDRFLFLA